MTATAFASPLAAAQADEGFAAVVSSPLRADLVIQRQLFRGTEYYVIKDPLALTYFRLPHDEGFLIMLLDGRRTLGEVHRLFHEHFPNKELTLQEVATFVNQMGSTGLLNINARNFVKIARAQEAAHGSWLLIWGHLISSLLFLRLPLLDPSPWLGRVAHVLRFIWTRWFIGLCSAFIVWTAFWLIVNREAFSQNTINFFSSENLLLLWVTIIFVKTLHEFGHATTCAHFGGEMHEMGVCLICFMPAGYVDASDAWMMRDIRHKLYTTAAGIFTEFVLASIAAYLWLYLPPGLAKNVAFNAMIAASINTVFFNANPLMKFDGYYVVSDLLEIPNLRAKSMAFCSYYVQRWLLGYRNLIQERVIHDERRGSVFVIYAILAYIYMMTVIYGLTQVFGRVLAPYGLHDFGLTLGIFVEGSFLMFPIVKVLSDAFVVGRGNTVREERASVRVARWLGPLLLVAVVVAYLPSHYHVVQQAVLVAAKSERAGVEVGGIVERVHVRTGEWVEAGQPLLTLSNADIIADERLSELTFESAKLRLASLQADGSLRTTALAPVAVLALDSAATGLDRARRAHERLVVRAPASGYVTTPDISRLEGQYLAAGFSGLRVANLRRFKLVIPLNETQVDLVEAGSEVRGYTKANATPIKTQLTVLPTQQATWDDYQPAMLTAFGGPAPFEYRAVNPRATPAFALFIAEADVPVPPSGAIEGLRVEVTITGRRVTYGQRFWRWFAGLWHPRPA